MNLNDLTVFQAVAEAGSFTGAAARLKLDKARVSRVVRRLEGEVGAALLVRSTRAVKLTAEGAELAARAGPHLAGLREAMQAASQEGAPEGEVVLATTTGVGRFVLGPMLARFRARHPGVRLRVRADDRSTDLLAEGVDLALRVGRPAASSYVARRLMELEAGFFASPTYLARRGTPAGPGDLKDHEGLWPEPPRGKRPFSVTPLDLKPRAPGVECGDFLVLAAVARAHGGVALLPTFLAREDVAQGALVRVLPQVALGQAPLYLLSRPEKPAPARVTALRRFLLDAFRDLA